MLNHRQSPEQASFSSARRGGRVLLMAAVAVGLAALAGCATAPAPEEVKMVWPEPPEVARIQFVRSIASDEDLQRDTTASQKILNFLGGEQPSANRLAEPQGLAVSDDGERLYVADHAQGAVFGFDFGKKKLLKIGGDGKPLGSPIGVALDGQENIYVVEQAKKGVSVYGRDGKFLRSFTDPSLLRPSGIAIDRVRGKVYVVDTAHNDNIEQHTVKIFDLQGKLLGHLGAGKGSGKGGLLFATYVTVDPRGWVYVADTLNSRVEVFDTKGEAVEVFGRRGDAWGMFDKPKGVALDSFGNLYVVDSGWSNVQIFNARRQVMLFFGGRGTAPGLLQNPTALAIDKHNRIYVADLLNNRVNVYQLVNTTAADSLANADRDASKAPSAKGGTVSTNQSAPQK